MRTKTIVKRFIFEEKNRDELTLGPETRLNPQEHKLMLIESNSGYPTTSDLFVKTRIFNPKSLVSWSGFDVYDSHEKNYDSVPYTSLGFRLSDGTNEFWWNGAAWEINVVDWNTENEVAANISDFPATSKKLQIVINLKSDNSVYTPEVTEIRVAYDSNIDFQDDLIFNSLVPLFRNIKPLSDYIVLLPTTTDTIDLDDFPLETPYDLIDIDSCFNYTDDPEKSIDIFSSYDSGTNTITLTGAVDSGKKVWIKFIYQPEISVSTDQEYVEVSKIPAIHILSYETTKNVPAIDYTAVRNKNGVGGIKASKIRQRSYEFTAASLTGSSIDQQRLQDEIRQLFIDNSFINFNGLDENFSIYLSRDFVMQTNINNLATYSAVFRFVIRDVVYFMLTEDVNTVLQFNIDGDFEITIE